MTTTSTRSPLIAQVLNRFQEVDFTPDFGPEGSRLLIALYRRLAETGEPISAAEVTVIAAELDISPEQATHLTDGMGETDDEGALRGIVGLSLNDHPHRFIVGEHELRNWCALDPLLIAPLMTEDVRLESDDPHTGETVRVSVTSEGIQAQQPPEAVISIVVPEVGATESVEAVWMMFCQQVHFFTSRDAGEQFFDGKDFEVYFLTLEEAFDLGRLAFAPLYEQLR